MKRIVMHPGPAATLALKILQGISEGNPSYAHDRTEDLFDALKDVRLGINPEGAAVVLPRKDASQVIYGLDVRIRSQYFELEKRTKPFRLGDVEKRMAHFDAVTAEFQDYRNLLEAFRQAYSNGNDKALLILSSPAEDSPLETLATAGRGQTTR